MAEGRPRAIELQREERVWRSAHYPSSRWSEMSRGHGEFNYYHEPESCGEAMRWQKDTPDSGMFMQINHPGRPMYGRGGNGFEIEEVGREGG